MIRLSEIEEEIMDNLWSLGRAFPKVIIAHLKEPKPPYNTILSAIRKLEKNGHVGYKKYGKSHEYFPILKKEQYGQSLFKKLFHDVLNGSSMGLLSYFAKEEKVDIEELKKILDDMKKESSNPK